MVNDDVLLVHTTQSVSLMIFHLAIAKTETHVAKNNVAGLDSEWIVCHTDAVAWSRLAGNGHIALHDGKFGFEEDGSRHIEHDSADALLFDSPTQCADRTIVSKRSDMLYSTATSTCDVAPETFRTGEGWCLLSRYSRSW